MAAINMFALSPAYRASFQRDESFVEKIFSRYEVICQSMTEEYATPRDTMPKIKQELRANGDDVASSMLSLETGRLRAAYAHLNLEESARPSKKELKQRAESNKHQQALLRPLLCMLEDGITTWEQVVMLDKKRRNALRGETARSKEGSSGEATSRQQVSAKDTDVFPNISPVEVEQVETTIAETAGTLDALPALPTAPLFSPEHIEELLAPILPLLKIVSGVMDALRQIPVVESRCAELEHVLCTSELALQGSQTEVDRLQNENIILKRRVNTLQEEKRASYPRMLEEIAQAVVAPIGALLLPIADALRTYEQERLRSAKPEGLPEEVLWTGFPGENETPKRIRVICDTAFRNTWVGIPEEVKEVFRKQLKNLCTHGPLYNSLDTKELKGPLKNSAAGEQYSKVNKSFRFTWSQEKGVLTLLEIGTKHQLSMRRIF